MPMSHTIFKTLSSSVNKFPYGTLRRFLTNNLFRLYANISHTILRPRSFTIKLPSEVLVPFTLSATARVNPGGLTNCYKATTTGTTAIFGVTYQWLLRMPYRTSRSSIHAWKIPGLKTISKNCVWYLKSEIKFYMENKTSRTWCRKI